MPSNKATSAGNQQERLKTLGWIVGFVDGEGCFAVTVQRNSQMSLGWQVFPEFVVTQRKSNMKSLKIIKNFFGCGKIYVNTRTDNHREDLLRFCVRSAKDLQNIIVPFFQANSLKTSKVSDFKHFAKVVQLMHDQKHLSKSGLKRIAGLSQKMNRKTPSKFLESSETKCQTR
jgi:hypothetical protein